MHARPKLLWETWWRWLVGRRRHSWRSMRWSRMTSSQDSTLLLLTGPQQSLGLFPGSRPGHPRHRQLAGSGCFPCCRALLSRKGSFCGRCHVGRRWRSHGAPPPLTLLLVLLHLPQTLEKKKTLWHS